MEPHPHDLRRGLPPSVRVPQPGAYWLDRLGDGRPVTELAGLPVDLSGWLAMVGICALLRNSGTLVGYRPSADFVYDSWRPVASIESGRLADLVRSAVSVGAVGRPDHPLRWYAGRQTAAGTLSRCEELVAGRDVEVDLTTPHSPDPECSTFYWSSDSSIPHTNRCGGGASAGRPTIEWLAWLGLSSLRWDLSRWDRENGHHIIWPLYPVEPARRWLRRITRTAPRSSPSFVRKFETWGCRVEKVDKYRRAACVPAPAVLVGRSLLVGGRGI